MIVQALYQMQLADHEVKELLSQCRERDDNNSLTKFILLRLFELFIRAKLNF